MARVCTAVLTVLLLAALPASAQTVITVGDHPVRGNTANQIIPILVTGPDIVGMDLAATIGAGGVELGGVAGPIFKLPQTRIEDTGNPGFLVADLPLWDAAMIPDSIWEGNSDPALDNARDDFVDSLAMPQPAYPYPQLFLGGITTEQADPGEDPPISPVEIAANGVLVNLVIDTTGFTNAGDWWHLKFDDTITVDIGEPGTPELVDYDIATQLLESTVVDAGDPEADPPVPPEYGIQAVAPITINNGTIQIVSTLTSQSSGSWDAGTTWDGGGSTPDYFSATEVGDHEVTVDSGGQQGFALLTDNSGSKVVVDATRTLSIYDSVDVDAGTVEVQGTLEAKSANVTGTVKIGRTGSLDVTGDVAMNAGSEYVCEVGDGISGLVAAGDDVTLDPASALEFTVTSSSMFTQGIYTLMTYDSVGGTSFGTSSGLGPYVTGDGLAYGANALTVTIDHDLLVGDLDIDGDVDFFDYIATSNHFGETEGMTFYDGDMDGDGDVDFFDYIAVSNHFGDTLPAVAAAPELGSVASASVPEPGSMILLLTSVACLVWWCRRRKKHQ